MRQSKFHQYVHRWKLTSYKYITRLIVYNNSHKIVKYPIEGIIQMKISPVFIHSLYSGISIFLYNGEASKVTFVLTMKFWRQMKASVIVRPSTGCFHLGSTVLKKALDQRRHFLIDSDTVKSTRTLHFVARKEWKKIRLKGKRWTTKKNGENSAVVERRD